MSKKSTDIGVGKKVLASALSAAMVVAFAPAVAMADADVDDGAAAAVSQSSDDGQSAESTSVVEVGSESALKDAVNAATAGTTIKLTNDIVLSDEFRISKDITIDLNGNNIYNTVDIWSSDDEGDNKVALFEIEGNVTFVGEGTVKAKENDCYTFNVNGGSLVIESGTYVGNVSVVQVQKGIVKINGGNFSLAQKWDGKSTYLINGIDANYADGTAKVAIAGGSFVDFNPAVSFSEHPEANFLVRGFTASGSNGVYTVSTPVAEVEGVKYGSLQAAVDVAPSGSTVRLIQDLNGLYGLEINKKLTLDLDGKTITSDNSATKYESDKWPAIINVVSGGDLTITGNGKIIGPKDEAGAALDARTLITVSDANAKVSVLNGTIEAGGKGSDGMYGLYASNGGTIVLGDAASKNGPTITSHFAPVGENFTTAPADITIYGGSYTAEANPVKSDGSLEWWSYFCAPLYLAGSGKINVQGGVFNGYYGVSTRYKDASQELTISGGQFNGTGSSLFVGDVNGKADSTADINLKKIEITGGMFSSDPSAYLASGYVVSGSGPYTVSKYVPAPVTPVDPTPTPTPTPEPAAPGTNVSGTDSAGNTVEATVTDNNKTTLPDGTEAAGSVEYKGTTSGSGSGQPASEAAIPSTVTANGSTYVVTKIADEAFEGQEQLTKVTIPETVVEIGSKAFANTSIASVVIPAATTVIGAGVFQGCDDLESVDISKAALTSIPADAFNGTAISSISIPGTVKSVGARAFKGTALKSVELPAATTTLGTAAFQGCASLKSADISKAALTEIPAYAFNGTSITSIDIPDTVKTIGKRAFKKTKLKTVSTDAEALERGAFSGCASLKSASLPEVTEIGEYAFYGNEALKTLTTGADLEAIGPKAFKGAGKFKVLRINSKRLTKSGVKGSLKGSAVTKVEVAVTGFKKTQDKYVKRYSKFFAKANSGKSVEVTKAKKASKK